MLFCFLLGRQPGVLMLEGLTTFVLYYLHIISLPLVTVRMARSFSSLTELCHWVKVTVASLCV